MNAKQLLNALRDGAIAERHWKIRTNGKPKYRYTARNYPYHESPQMTIQASTINAIPTKLLIARFEVGGYIRWQYNFWTVKLTAEQLIVLDRAVVLGIAVSSALYADSGFVEQVDGCNRLTKHAYAYWWFLRSNGLYISREGKLVSEDEMIRDSIYAK